MLFMAAYNLVDTFWVARLGDAAMAGLTLVFPFEMIRVALGVGSGTGVLSLAARYFGAGDTERANVVAGHVLLLTGVISLPLTLVGLYFPEALLRFVGAPADALPHAVSYLSMIAWGSPLVIFAMLGANLLRGAGNTFAPMVFMIISALVNVVLDPLLIFGWYGFPAMGVRGAALATVLSQAVVTLLSISYFVVRKTGYTPSLRHLRPSFAILRAIYAVGIPTMTMQLLTSMVIAIYNRILGGYGATAVAAYGIMFRCLRLVWMPLFGFAQGLMPVVGYNYGARNLQRMWSAIFRTLAVGFGFMTVACIALEVLAPQVAGLFASDPELLRLIPWAMRIHISSLPFMGPLVVSIVAMQGMGHGRPVLLLSLLRRAGMLLPMLYVLPRYWGLNGVWISKPLSDMLAFSFVVAWMWKLYRRDHPVVLACPSEECP